MYYLKTTSKFDLQPTEQERNYHIPQRISTGFSGDVQQDKNTLIQQLSRINYAFLGRFPGMSVVLFPRKSL